MGMKLKYALPERTLNTMSDAIGLSSPNGRMSKRMQAKTSEQLRVALFGEKGLHFEVEQPSEAEVLTRQIGNIEDLLSRGMKPKGYKKALATWKARLAELSN